jgi:hypothetical protein
MNKITLTRDKIATITVETTEDKCMINYTFIKDDNNKDSLEDYIYLLEKISSYMKSGEYKIEEEST